MATPSTPDYAVGVCATQHKIYAGGLFDWGGSKFFGVVKYQFPATAAPPLPATPAQVEALASWPPNDDLTDRTVAAMAYDVQNNSDAAKFVLAGNVTSVGGYQRVVTVRFTETGSKFVSEWPRIEDGPSESIGDYAVDVAIGGPLLNGQATLTGTVARSVMPGGKSRVLAYVYELNSSALARTIVWKAASDSDDVPIGIGLAPENVLLIAGTTDRNPALPGTQHKRMFVLAIDIATGAHLTNSPHIEEPGSGYSLEAAASATAAAGEFGTTSIFAITGTRTTNSSGLRAIYTRAFAPNEAVTHLQTSYWAAPEVWDGTLLTLGSPADCVATAIHVAGFSPTDENPTITAGFRVWVGGTQATQTGKDWVTVQYGPVPFAHGRREWWDVWNRPDVTGDDVPAQIKYYQPHADARRIYVTGKSQSSSGDFDMATLKYEAEVPVFPGSQRTSAWHALKSIPIGNDFARSVFPAPGMFGELAFFVTGVSQGSGTADDWLTIRYTDPQP